MAKTAVARPFAKGSIIWEKRAGLPIWQWAAVLLLVLLLVLWWRYRRSGTSGQTGDTISDANGYSWPLPGDQTPPPVFIVPSAATPAVNVTNTTPPATVTVVPATVPTAPPAAGAPPPVAPPGGSTPTPAPPGGYVTTTKYPDSSVPRESTLWDIAGSWLPAGPSNWGQIWNHPYNAQLRSKRGDPRYIQPGDVWFVPNKLATPRSSY